MTWKLKHDVDQDIALIYCEGDVLGEEQGPDLIEVVNNIISKNLLKCIIDISGIKYINSSGLGVLITVLTKFRNLGGDIVLLQPSEHVNKLLMMTKLNAIFSIEQNMEEAKKKMKE